MTRDRSLVARIAWAAAWAASVAALASATTTSVLAAWLLQRAEDRRLIEAAVVLAAELAEVPADLAHVEEVVRDEIAETDHTGISFAVLDPAGTFLAGDPRLVHAEVGSCAIDPSATWRWCASRSANGLTAVAASAYTSPTGGFAVATAGAALLAGAAVWLVNRPLARATLAPLDRLRARLSSLDPHDPGPWEIGPEERVPEVDQLRSTIRQLLDRVTATIDQARSFSANAAHELRTPLTMVRAELELLAEDPTVTDGARAALARVEGRVAELATLVERLLVLAQPRAPDPLAEAVSVRDLLDDAAAALPPSERARVHTSEADAVVVGDSVLLATMVANALSNALKFGREAWVTVHVDGHDLVVHVDDDGPGVPPEDRERVFEPFHRGADPLTRRVPGHGLGLALVRHVAVLHGGRAGFVDPPARGARLEIRLPVAGSR